MFNRKKIEQENRGPDWLYDATAKVPHVPSLVDKLRDARTEKVKAANDLDREIAALDRDISYIDRHPDSAHILQMIARKFDRESSYTPDSQ